MHQTNANDLIKLDLPSVFTELKIQLCTCNLKKLWFILIIRAIWDLIFVRVSADPLALYFNCFNYSLLICISLSFQLFLSKFFICLHLQFFFRTWVYCLASPHPLLFLEFKSRSNAWMNLVASQFSLFIWNVPVACSQKPIKSVFDLLSEYENKRLNNCNWLGGNSGRTYAQKIK